MDGWIDRLMDGWMNVWIPGGSLIFPCIRRIGSFFFGGGGGVRILNFDIFGGFQKNKYFFFWGWGYQNFVDIFFFFFFFWGGGGSSQNWTIFRGHFYAF